MSETEIEKRRWRAQRILRADAGVCEEWQRWAAMAYLKATKPGRQPDRKVTDRLRRAWVDYWNHKREEFDVIE